MTQPNESTTPLRGWPHADSCRPRPGDDAITQLLEKWEARSRGANPCDAMLINKHIRELREALVQPAQEPVTHSVISGVLFDFMGWLTSRSKRITLSSSDRASPAVDAIVEFAKMRGLSLDDAKVRDWQTGIAPKQAGPASCRIELVGAIHTLASHYENRLHRLDPEDRKLAEGDIAHAMKIAAKWNWNGTSPTPPGAKS